MSEKNENGKAPAFPDVPGCAWTVDDDKAAAAEGWNIFDADGVLEIERIDFPDSDAELDEHDEQKGRAENSRFADDDAVLEFVRAQAAAGSALHKRALEIHECGFRTDETAAMH